jgi:hypothetical protein
MLPVMAPDFGLCDSCRHQRLVRNTRGSTFSLCERSRTDDRFPKYPRVPVLACPGHEPGPDARTAARSEVSDAAARA